jgi:hypothetical protein
MHCGLVTVIYAVRIIAYFSFTLFFDWRALSIKDLVFMPAIAVLWIDFVREIRWCWEESERLPRMKSSSSIDLSSCLIHQKLQMVHQYFLLIF